MRDRAVALGSKGDLRGIGLHIVDKLCDGFGRERRLNREHAWRGAEYDYGRKFRGLEGKLLIKAIVDRDWARWTCQQHVTISGRTRHNLSTDIAAGACTVIDDHRLAPLVGEFLPDDARQGGGWSARRERHGHPPKGGLIALL